jgi:hypothetical protein
MKGHNDEVNRWKDRSRIATDLKAQSSTTGYLESFIRTSEETVKEARRISETQEEFSLSRISELLKRSGTLRLRFPRKVTAFIAERLTQFRYDYREKLNAQAIGNILYGLQCCDDFEEVRKILVGLIPKIAQCPENLDAQAVADSLHGLQRLSDSMETRELVAVLIPKIEQCTEGLRAQHISEALYGMQCLGDSEEVRALVATLTPKIEQCTEKLDAQAVGKALYGLKCLRDSHEARKLIAVLTPKIEQCTEEFGVKTICEALHGLEGLGDSEEMRKLMATLSSKAEQCTEQVNAERICVKLQGLRSIGVSARKILSVLTNGPKSTGKLDAEAVRVLSALRALGDAEYVQKIFAEIQVERRTCTFEDVHGVSDTLLKLQNFTDREEVRNLVAVLTAKTVQLTEKLIRQNVYKTLYGLTRVGDSEQVRLLIAAWSPEIERCKLEPHMKECEKVLYGLENAVATALYGGFEHGDARISLEEQMRSRRSLYGESEMVAMAVIDSRFALTLADS